MPRGFKPHMTHDKPFVYQLAMGNVSAGHTADTKEIVINYNISADQQ
jgi:hypothetical protein